MAWQSGWVVATSNGGRGRAHVYWVDTRKDFAQIVCRAKSGRTASLRMGKIGTRIGAFKRLSAHPGDMCNLCMEAAHRATRAKK